MSALEHRERIVLVALSGLKEPTRAGAIVRDTDFRVVTEILMALEKRGLVSAKPMLGGKDGGRWFITDAGRTAINTPD